MTRQNLTVATVACRLILWTLLTIVTLSRLRSRDLSCKRRLAGSRASMAPRMRAVSVTAAPPTTPRQAKV